MRIWSGRLYGDWCARRIRSSRPIIRKKAKSRNGNPPFLFDVFLQETILKIHVLYLLLEIGTLIDIQSERNILVSKDFGEEFDSKLRYLDCLHCEGTPDLMNFYFPRMLHFIELH